MQPQQLVCRLQVGTAQALPRVQLGVRPRASGPDFKEKDVQILGNPWTQERESRWTSALETQGATVRGSSRPRSSCHLATADGRCVTQRMVFPTGVLPGWAFFPRLLCPHRWCRGCPRYRADGAFLPGTQSASRYQALPVCVSIEADCCCPVPSASHCAGKRWTIASCVFLNRPLTSILA